ncbi:hypothetical protein RRG08_060764 [Elysia crispata]|uniref:Uncharacterized protein n=1 Tax=Elysia crispata TaxID=231223 RepID=A0AAE1CQS9_9GAST|nr:hypothetical protein RRG08_060764 [Elysia crispata]
MSGAPISLASTQQQQPTSTAAAATAETSTSAASPCRQFFSHKRSPRVVSPTASSPSVYCVVAVVVVVINVFLIAPVKGQIVRYVYYQGAPGDRGSDGPRGQPGQDGRPMRATQSHVNLAARWRRKIRYRDTQEKMLFLAETSMSKDANLKCALSHRVDNPINLLLVAAVRQHSLLEKVLLNSKSLPSCSYRLNPDCSDLSLVAPAVAQECIVLTDTTIAADLGRRPGDR